MSPIIPYRSVCPASVWIPYWPLSKTIKNKAVHCGLAFLFAPYFARSPTDVKLAFVGVTRHATPAVSSANCGPLRGIARCHARLHGSAVLPCSSVQVVSSRSWSPLHNSRLSRCLLVPCSSTPYCVIASNTSSLDGFSTIILLIWFSQYLRRRRFCWATIPLASQLAVIALPLARALYGSRLRASSLSRMF